MLSGGTHSPEGRGPTQVGPRLISVACDFYGIEQSQLFSKQRRGALSLARWTISNVLYDDIGWSLPRIGKLLGKDHKSILYGLRKSRDLIRTDPLFFEAVARLRSVVSPQ
jgi:chromosomal replication initiation ATPase DnaA